MNQIWKRKRADKWDPDMEEEFQVVNQALQHYDKLGMVGGVLWADREVVVPLRWENRLVEIRWRSILKKHFQRSKEHIR